VQNLFQLHLDGKLSIFGPVTVENAAQLAGMAICNMANPAEIEL
jgi:hypothetical protein